MHKHNNKCKLCGSNNTHSFVWGRMVNGETVERNYTECNDCGCIVPTGEGFNPSCPDKVKTN